MLKKEGIKAGIEAVNEKIKEFPLDETFILTAIYMLEACLNDGITSENDNKIFGLQLDDMLSKVADSSDQRIQFNARSAQVRNLITGEDFQKAQDLLDSMNSWALDKKPAEIQLALAKKDYILAERLLDENLLSGTTEMLNSLIQKTELSAEMKDHVAFDTFIMMAQKIIEEYSLAPMIGLEIQLIQATYYQNAEIVFQTLEKMLDPVSYVWNPNQSGIYSGLKSKSVDFGSLFFNHPFEKLLPDTSYLEKDSRYKKLKMCWEKLYYQSAVLQ